MSQQFLPPTFSNIAEWVRKAAGVINGMLSRRNSPFEMLATAPTSPVEGDIYYDTALHKYRNWDGTAWQNWS